MEDHSLRRLERIKEKQRNNSKEANLSKVVPRIYEEAVNSEFEEE